MSEEKYSALCKSRKYARANVSRIHTQIVQLLDSLTEDKLLRYNEKLLSLKSELDDLNKDIHVLIPDDIDINQLINEEEEYEDKISQALAIIKNKKGPINPPPIINSDILNSANRLKLPTIALPEFSNEKTECLDKFLYAFESIINKHNLSEYEKFIYLKGQLNKGPLALVNSLNNNEQNYQCAKDLLTKAFASPTTQKYDVLERLTKLRFSYDDDIYVFISEMRNIITTVATLNIDVETIIQYFIWMSMNDRLQNQIVNITNKTKPNLDDINSVIFDAADRYLKLKDHYDEKRKRALPKFTQSRSEHSSKQHRNDFQHRSESRSDYQSRSENIKTSNMAVNVKQKPLIICNLCKADKKSNITHSMRDCKEYINANDKIKKLDSLGYCSKCSFANHNTANCRFKFSSPCKSCKGSHLIFLCTKNTVTPESVSNVSCVYFNNVIENDNILLPTFTVQLDNGLKCRVLADTGSQRNFVNSKLDEENNFEILDDNLNVVIKGFNARKNVKTKVVKIPVKIEGNYMNIEAIVVPNIDITMRAENLKLITDSFICKGYSLADETLRYDSNTVSGFDLVMGPDCFSVLCPTTIRYSNNNKSPVYLKTENNKIMLLGEVPNIINNLAHLKSINMSNSKETNNNFLFTEKENVRLNDDHVISANTTSVTDVLDEFGEINSGKLAQATSDALEQSSKIFLSCDDDSSCDEVNEVNKKVENYVLTNTDRLPDGRLVMPLPWNPACKHLLGRNYKLSQKILMSNLNKLKKNNLLSMYDQVFQEQEHLGIIERVEDINKFIEENPNCSFLPHMGVVRMNKETSKVRVVYLSNLCEQKYDQAKTVSHNNALLPGPCLNSKLSYSLMLSRFDKYVLIFDITKAFLAIGLREEDQQKLMCLWFKSVERGDYSIIAYKNKRLSFGLRPSPAVLMLALYKIMILDTDNDDDDTIYLKKQIYNNIYMDNGLVSANNITKLYHYYNALPKIFGDYQMQLQQFATNCPQLQKDNDEKLQCSTDDVVGFFGMHWDRINDELGPCKMQLDSAANTKRKILASLNAVYDLFNVSAPLLNRAKIFMHKIQCSKNLKWDDVLEDDCLSEWRNICKQVNNIPKLRIPRYVGDRHDEYALVCFTDASAAIYGVVVYLVNLNTGKVSFLCSKNRIIGIKLHKKSIPSLECQGVAFGSEILYDCYNDLTNDNNVLPINVKDLYVYTDSMVTLQWIRGYHMMHEKMQKRSTFVLNRLKQIGDICNKISITYRFTEGSNNPADFVTRPTSYNQLIKTNYFNGPSMLSDLNEQPDLEVKLPVSSMMEVSGYQIVTHQNNDYAQPLVNINNYSSVKVAINVCINVLKFIHKLKCRVMDNAQNININFHNKAVNLLIRNDHKKYFPDVVAYFETKEKIKSKIPNLVLQLNLFLDENSLIRVKGKFKHNYFPILLPCDSYLTTLFILETHERLSHVGVFTVLRELRRQFWILRAFSVVRKTLRKCIKCKKLNARPIQLNQGLYREFRSNPTETPFSSIFIDHLGPLTIKINGVSTKVWILILTCLYTRAISLEISFAADVKEFLRCLQLHIYKYGLFQYCYSDLGSQIVAGGKIISDFLNDPVCDEYFRSQGITCPQFENYARGNSSLGSLVECCVKQTKHLFYKSIGKTVLDYKDFQLIVTKTIHILNRRPVAFKETLSSNENNNDTPIPITPEMLLYGRDLKSVNIVPHIQSGDEGNDPDFHPTARNMNDSYAKVRKVHAKLRDVYHEQFLTQLMSQSTDKKNRYERKNHHALNIGDVVLLVEPHLKQFHYPMGIVKKVNTNSLGEVTSAVIFKGGTREEVYRHVSSLIYLMSSIGDDEKNDETETSINDNGDVIRPKRLAAIKASANNRCLSDNDLI